MTWRKPIKARQIPRGYLSMPDDAAPRPNNLSAYRFQAVDTVEARLEPNGVLLYRFADPKTRILSYDEQRFLLGFAHIDDLRRERPVLAELDPVPLWPPRPALVLSPFPPYPAIPTDETWRKRWRRERSIGVWPDTPPRTSVRWAKNTLALFLHRKALRLASHRMWSAIPYDARLSAVLFGLALAIRKYNAAEHDTGLDALARWWIRKALQQALIDQRRFELRGLIDEPESYAFARNDLPKLELVDVEISDSRRAEFIAEYETKAVTLSCSGGACGAESAASGYEWNLVPVRWARWYTKAELEGFALVAAHFRDGGGVTVGYPKDPPKDRWKATSFRPFRLPMSSYAEEYRLGSDDEIVAGPPSNADDDVRLVGPPVGVDHNLWWLTTQPPSPDIAFDLKATAYRKYDRRDAKEVVDQISQPEAIAKALKRGAGYRDDGAVLTTDAFNRARRDWRSWRRSGDNPHRYRTATPLREREVIASRLHTEPTRHSPFCCQRTNGRKVRDD
jgi:hypothetical protein